MGGNADVLACRTCGKPRGENIANGTRCARCGSRQSLMVCLAAGLGAAVAAYLSSSDLRHAMGAAVVGTIAAPFAWVTTAAVHELGHAAAAWCLGQTLTRIVIGEGSALWKRGSDPQVVIGSVVMGNASAAVMDLRPDGYRARTAAVLLAGPIASAVTGLVVMIAGAGRSTAIQTAAALFAFFSFAMTAVTLIPVPTFGGRVWSDLATVLYLLRATDRALEEDRLLGAQERVVVLLESGMPERAIRTARTAVETAPRAPRAYGLLAYALHHAGHADEAGDVARGALDLAQDDATRAYLRQYVGIERS